MRCIAAWLVLAAFTAGDPSGRPYHVTVMAVPCMAIQDGDPPEVEEAGEMEEEDPGEGDGKAPEAKAPPPLLPVRASLPGSSASVCITLRDFRPEAAEEGAGDPAEPSLLFGHLGEGRTTLALTAERDEPKRPAALRRDREAKRLDPPPVLFEVDGVPCLLSEAVYPEAPGAKQLHFHAYPAAAGWSFDLHVSAVSFVGKPPFSRADFEAVARTLRFGWFRRGFPDLLPPAVLSAMDGAARRAPAEARFLEEAARARPADGAVRLALGEALLASDRPEPAAGAFEKAAELLAAGAGPEAPREARFALWLALDGAAAASLRSAKADRARGHLLRARELAAGLGAKEIRAATIYALARCAGEKGEGAAAAALLGEAFELDPSLRPAARDEPSFRKVRLSREFKAAVEE